MALIAILTDQTTNVTTDNLAIGGTYAINISGVFGGATVGLLINGDALTDNDGIPITKTTAFNANLETRGLFSASVSGATGTTSISLTLEKI